MSNDNEGLFKVTRIGGSPNGAGSTIAWTQDQIKYIVDEYNKVHSVPKIAKGFNCSSDAIRRMLKKQGIILIPIQERSKQERPRNSDYFENIDSKDKAYWLGFLYADGYVHKK